MAKLYFKYGAMGSSKSAQALITQFNYEELGMTVWLIKPSLRRIVDEQNIPVLCFGLRTDFLTHFFPGARRLMELADSITEIKTVCACGRKATVNARIDERGRVITEGGQILLGGNDSYVAMCHKCWVDKIRAQKEAEKA